MTIVDYNSASAQLREFHKEYEAFRFATAYTLYSSMKISDSQLDDQRGIEQAIRYEPIRLAESLKDQFGLDRVFRLVQVEKGTDESDYLNGTHTIKMKLKRIII